MTPLIQRRVQEWLTGPYDANSKEELQTLMNDPEKVVDAFYTDLSFGTGGLRGLMGVGTNRMNIYTIRKTTQGLANYILREGKPEKGVLIGFDSRHNSDLFAREAAHVLAGNGISVYLLTELRPTPFISFACREKKCQAAIMITASHNPKEYNGYKVYWEDGAQVVPPHDIGIMQEVEAIHVISHVKRSAENDPLISLLKSELDSVYISAIHSQQHFPEQNKKSGKDLKITYTSLHGTGITLMPQALSSWGFNSISFVEKQIIPDGGFPTVKLPNPEYAEALKLGIERMQETKSDILLATDPDADRIGVSVIHQGKAVILNGNEIASLCGYFLCETLSQKKAIPSKAAFVTTIVTTELLKVISRAYDIACIEVLTGFKYIGEKIHHWELAKEGYRFLFGAEESYGYLIGTHSRDKDGIVIGCLLAEIALQMKRKNQTLVDLLHEIYKKFGIFREKQLSTNFEAGKEGVKKIAALMQSLRHQPPKTLAGQKVVEVIDLEKGKHDGLPHADVLIFRLADESKLVIRPSGTEPKIKIYAGAQQKNFSSIEEGIKNCDGRLEILLNFLNSSLSSS